MFHNRTFQTLTTASSPDWLRRIRLELAGGVKLINTDADKWVLVHGRASVSFRLPPGNLPAVFSSLGEEGCLIADLLPLFEDHGPFSVREQLLRLWQQGLLIETIRADGQVKAILRASGNMPIVPEFVQPEQVLVLSEDMCIRMQDGALLLESLEYGAVIEFRDAHLCQVPILLSAPIRCAELVQRGNATESVIMCALNWLLRMKAVHTLKESLSRKEEINTWQFADRLLHARSRNGRHLGGYGGTYRFSGRIATPPDSKPSRGAPRTPLPKPNLHEIAAADRPFTSVLEERHSIREHSPEPITVEELSEFLYRSARLKYRKSAKDEVFATRPFPSAGGLYELEFYVLVNRCAGLEAGLYHYDGADHALERVSSASQSTHAILMDGVRSCSFTGNPHTLIVLAARFPRVNWKYESIAYSLILKNVGVVYQTMYLVAAAMGLAACALGGGSGVYFGEATGLDYWEESAVGEFVLGRPPRKAAAFERSGSARQEASQPKAAESAAAEGSEK
jgi:oxazoline/thiazoline dehydrogenase